MANTQVAGCKAYPDLWVWCIMPNPLPLPCRPWYLAGMLVAIRLCCVVGTVGVSTAVQALRPLVGTSAGKGACWPRRHTRRQQL